MSAKAELKSLHSKAHTKSAIGKAKEWYGERCANCGTEKDIEWHHIVPLYVGGTNSPSNLVPLCTDCHHAVHTGVRYYEHKKKSDGRKPRTTNEEQRSAFIDYVFCRIPKKEACRIIGVSRIDQCRPQRWMTAVLDELGVERFKNNLELNLVQHGFVNQKDPFGWVKEKGRKRNRVCYAQRDMTAEEFKLTRMKNEKDGENGNELLCGEEQTDNRGPYPHRQEFVWMDVPVLQT